MVVTSATDKAFWDGVWSGRVEALTVAGLAAYAFGLFSMNEAIGDDEAEAGGGVDYARELRETRELMGELEAEHDIDPLAAAIERPVDGTYTGDSAEDDAGDQAVLTRLTFHRDGTISGDGNDGVDGAYEISTGRWSDNKVAWIEKYDEGFTVALRGQVRPDGTILALWASSRGVGGTVELQRPPPPR